MHNLFNRFQENDSEVTSSKQIWRSGYTFLLFLIFTSLVFSCKSGTDTIHDSPFVPWKHTRDAPLLNKEWTTEYMNSRPPRIVKTINGDWKFNYLPSSLENKEINQPEFNDDFWQAISIPHTWKTFETTGELHPYIKYPSERYDSYWWRGWGYYRKRFYIDRELENKKIFVEFDGVQKYSRVYMNGHYVGDHKGGFNSFYFDLTPFINWEGDNVLVVSVNNDRRDGHSIPPMTAGNWNPYGGIYRDVRLVVKNHLYIPFQGSYKHEGGTFVTTPEVSSEKAVVNIKTFLKNEFDVNISTTLVSTIIDQEGNKVESLSKEKIIEPGEITKFEQLSPPIDNPELWSPDNPYLYKVISEVYKGNELTDRYESPLGFRWFEWDYENSNLYLNGEKINIKGTNRHQEFPWLGDAIPKWIAIRDMQDIKFGLGHNFIRTAHYTNDPVIYDFNNQFGLITVEEVPNIKNIEFNPEIQRRNVIEMIRRDRNHPSIIMWSMGNETSHGADSKWAVAEDTTRIIHSRKAERTGDYVDHDHNDLDMEHLLRVTIRGWFDKDDVPEGVEPEPQNGQHTGTEVWQHRTAMIRDGSVRGILGENCVAWIYHDHGLDRKYRNSPLFHVNAKGWVDNYRIPKYLYYLTQVNYTEIPTIFIHPHYWRTKYTGQKKDIVIDSNLDEIEVFVNGESRGIFHPAGSEFNTIILQDFLIEEGELIVRGLYNRKVITSSLQMPGEPYKIELIAEKDEVIADRSGINIVTAYVLDKNGNFVFDATNTLTWKVKGHATLVGPRLYETDINKVEEWAGTGYNTVPVSNLIRSKNQPGLIKIEVHSDGLITGEFEFQSVLPVEKDPGLIIQPQLSDERSKPVIRDKEFVEQVKYQEALMFVNESFSFQDIERSEWEEAVNRYIKEMNPLLDYSGIGYDLLLNQLVNVLERMEGLMIADDYNFIINEYNSLMTIFEAIEISDLHLEYEEMLKTYYAEKILEKILQVDMENEIKLIQSIPGHIPLQIMEPTSQHPYGTVINNYVSEVFTVYAYDPEEAINLAFPEFMDMDYDLRLERYEYIARITPYVDFDMENSMFFFRKDKLLIIPFFE